MSGGKGLTKELRFLLNELMRSEEENHIKIDQHQDGHMSFAIYVGDKSIYESSECYETAGIVSCEDKGLSFRVKELRADDTEQFISLGIYDKEDHLGTYAVKLCYS